jgi:hypothetical protein
MCNNSMIFIYCLLLFVLTLYYVAKNIPFTQACYTNIIKHYAETQNVDMMVSTFEALQSTHIVTPAVYPPWFIPPL